MKKVKRILSVVLCLVMLLCAVPVMNLGMKAKAMSLFTFNERLEKFKSEVYGEGDTYNDSANGSSPGSTYGWQCFGFANYLTKYIFGSFPCSIDNASNLNENWSIARGNAGINNLCIGDVIRYYNTTGNYHSIVVTGIDGDTISFCDANRVGSNKITYNGSYSRSYLSGRLTMGSSETRCWIAHWKEGVDSALTAVSLDNAINIQEGVYSIHSARDKNMVLDISGDSQESGANIQVYHFLDNNVQKFRIKKSGNYYTIQSVHSNHWLDIKTPIVNRSNVQLYKSNTFNEEKWFFEDAGNGFVAIRNYYGYYVDIAGDSAVNNANVQAYNTLESNSQKWRLVPDAPSSSISIPEGVYTIHSAWNKNKVLDIQGDSQASGANIQLFDFRASNYDVQRFRVAKSGKYYTIQSVYSNNWLDIKTPITHRSNIQLYSSNTFNEEKWFFEDAGNGYVNIRNYYGYYVDIAGDSTENRANIQAFRTKYNDSQRWWLVPDNYTINIDANGGTASTSSFAAKYGDKINLNSSFVQRTGGYKLKGWNLYRPADGKWHVAGVGWRTPAEISAGGYEKQVYVPNLSMTIDYSWIYSFSGLVSSISSFTFYAVWEECSHTWDSGTVIKEATANEEGIIRYTCTTCGGVKDVSIAALQPTGITVDLTRVKRSYYIGEFLDTSGLKLSATYSDGTTETVRDGFTCSPSKLTTSGTQTITVNYAGKTCNYEVNVKVEEPAPYWGDMNDDKRIDDSDAEFINQYLKGYVELSDEQKCFADVDFNGNVNATDSIILQRYVKGFEPIPATSKTDINLITTKNNYNTGDALELEDFQIVVSSTDSAAVSYTIADGFTLSGYDPNEVGMQTISTTFRGIELSTTIMVVKVEHTHTWNAGTITKDATCAFFGEKTFTCTSCGETKTETLAKNESNHVGGIEIQGAKAATCSAEGCTGDVYCNGCGVTLYASTSIAKTEHTWNSDAVIKAATCTATGTKTYTCTGCGDTYTETIPVDTTNHVNTTNVAATASTCTVKGYSAGIYCNDCKKYISGHQEQPLAAHQTITQNARAATCTAEGYTGDQYCTVCKQTISTGSTIGKKAHTLTTINKKDAGCTTTGYTGDQYCTVCKQTISTGSTINALGHTAPDGNGNCTRCGTHIKDVTPPQPQPNPNACKYCGEVHSGPFGWLIKFFHSILAIFKR